MLELPKQSREGLHQLFIDIKGLATKAPKEEIPLVIKDRNMGNIEAIKLVIYVFILGCIAGIGYILITNPAGLMLRLVQIWESFVGLF
jgi:hypothetical protein